MANLFPIHLTLSSHDWLNSVPISVPFCFQNEWFTICKQDHHAITTTTTYIINREFKTHQDSGKSCIFPQFINENDKQTLQHVILFMMNAAHEEFKRQQQQNCVIQNYTPCEAYQQQTNLQQLDQKLHELKCAQRQLELQKHFWLKQNNPLHIFHHDHQTSTSDLLYYQPKLHTLNKKKVAFKETCDRATITDSTKQQDTEDAIEPMTNDSIA